MTMNLSIKSQPKKKKKSIIILIALIGLLFVIILATIIALIINQNYAEKMEPLILEDFVKFEKNGMIAFKDEVGCVLRNDSHFFSYDLLEKTKTFLNNDKVLYCKGFVLPIEEGYLFSVFTNDKYFLFLNEWSNEDIHLIKEFDCKSSSHYIYGGYDENIYLDVIPDGEIKYNVITGKSEPSDIVVSDYYSKRGIGNTQKLEFDYLSFYLNIDESNISINPYDYNESIAKILEKWDFVPKKAYSISKNEYCIYYYRELSPFSSIEVVFYYDVYNDVFTYCNWFKNDPFFSNDYDPYKILNILINCQ